MKIEYGNCSQSSLAEDIMVLLQSSGTENAMLQELETKAKHNFVSLHHSRSIFQLHSTNKYMDGKWKTHVYVDGKRKGVTCKTMEELYDYLYDFYKAAGNKGTSFADVFQLFLEDKVAKGRSRRTISEDTRRFKSLDEKIQAMPITDITEDMLTDWLLNSFLLRTPKPEGLKKMVQLLNAIFCYGRRKKLCMENPAEDIDFHNYLHLCDLMTKSNEERSFSAEELSKLREAALKDVKNPHACMILVSMETGLRIAELPPLRKCDIHDDYIHVHRQQIRQEKDDTHDHQFYYDVNYTKNERLNPQNGRKLPISANCVEALHFAEALPGESEYLFHHADGSPVNKDAYGQYLKRMCRRLGIKTTNNHAFRVAYNAMLIRHNLDSIERSYLLGHSMQTNEKHYSHSDERRFNKIRSKLGIE